MKKNKNTTKTELLEQLESIHDSLLDDIPVLTDNVEEETYSSDESLLDEKMIFDDEELIEDNAMEDEVAEEAVVEEETTVDEELLKAAYRETLADAEEFLNEAPNVLPGQRSLFSHPEELLDGDLNKTGVRRAIKPEDYKDVELPHAEGENPFLPQHIRDKLSKGKSNFMEDIAQVSQSLSKMKPSTIAPAEVSLPVRGNQQALLDELVAKYLPQIEFELRSRLSKLLENQENENDTK